MERDKFLARARTQTHPYDVQRGRDIYFKTGKGSISSVEPFNVVHKFPLPFRGTGVGPIYLQLNECALDASLIIKGSDILQKGVQFQPFVASWEVASRNCEGTIGQTAANRNCIVYRFTVTIANLSDFLFLPYTIVTETNKQLWMNYTGQAGFEIGPNAPYTGTSSQYPYLTYEAATSIISVAYYNNPNVNGTPVATSTLPVLMPVQFPRYTKLSKVDKILTSSVTMDEFFNISIARRLVMEYVNCMAAVMLVSFAVEIGPQFTRIVEGKSLELIRHQLDVSQINDDLICTSFENMTALPTDMAYTSFYTNYTCAARLMPNFIGNLIFSNDVRNEQHATYRSCILSNIQMNSEPADNTTRISGLKQGCYFFASVPCLTTMGTCAVLPDERSLKNNIYQKPRDPNFGCVPNLTSKTSTMLYRQSVDGILSNNSAGLTINKSGIKMLGAPFLFDLTQTLDYSDEFLYLLNNLDPTINLQRSLPLYAAQSPWCDYIDIQKWSTYYNDEPLGYSPTFVASAIYGEIKQSAYYKSVPLEGDNISITFGVNNTTLQQSAGQGPAVSPREGWPVYYHNYQNLKYPYERYTWLNNRKGKIDFNFAAIQQILNLYDSIHMVYMRPFFWPVLNPKGTSFQNNLGNATFGNKGLLMTVENSLVGNTIANAIFLNDYTTAPGLYPTSMLANARYLAMTYMDDSPTESNPNLSNSLFTHANLYTERYSMNGNMRSAVIPITALKGCRKFQLNTFLMLPNSTVVKNGTTFDNAYNLNGTTIATSVLNPTVSISQGSEIPPPNGFFLNSGEVGTGNFGGTNLIFHPGVTTNYELISGDPCVFDRCTNVVENFSKNSMIAIFHLCESKLLTYSACNTSFIAPGGIIKTCNSPHASNVNTGCVKQFSLSVVLSKQITNLMTVQAAEAPTYLPTNLRPDRFGTDDDFYTTQFDGSNPSDLAQSTSLQSTFYRPAHPFFEANNSYPVRSTVGANISPGQISFALSPVSEIDASLDFDLFALYGSNAIRGTQSADIMMLPFQGPYTNEIMSRAYPGITALEYIFIPKVNFGAIPVHMGYTRLNGSNNFDGYTRITSTNPVNLDVRIIGGTCQSLKTPNNCVMFDIQPTGLNQEVFAGLNVMLLNFKSDINKQFQHVPLVTIMKAPNVLAIDSFDATDVKNFTLNKPNNLPVDVLQPEGLNPLLFTINELLIYPVYTNRFTNLNRYSVIRDLIKARFNLMSHQLDPETLITSLSIDVVPTCEQIPKDVGLNLKAMLVANVQVEFNVPARPPPDFTDDLLTWFSFQTFNARVTTGINSTTYSVPSQAVSGQTFYPLVGSYNYGDMSSGYQGLEFGLYIGGRQLNLNAVNYYNFKCRFAEREPGNVTVASYRNETGNELQY